MYHKAFSYFTLVYSDLYYKAFILVWYLMDYVLVHLKEFSVGSPSQNIDSSLFFGVFVPSTFVWLQFRGFETGIFWIANIWVVVYSFRGLYTFDILWINKITLFFYIEGRDCSAILVWHCWLIWPIEDLFTDLFLNNFLIRKVTGVLKRWWKSKMTKIYNIRQ